MSSDRAAPAQSSPDLLEYLIRQTDIRYLHGTLQHHARGYAMRCRVLRHHNLIYVLRGRAQWVVEDRPIDLGPDHWTWVAPGQWHHARGLTRRLTLMSYHIDATLAGGRDLLAMVHQPPILATRRTSRLARMVRLSRLEYDRASESTATFMLEQWARLIVPEALREAASGAPLTIDQISPTVTQVARWIRDHLDQPVTLAILERISGYSGQHLNRLFKASLGVTTMRYVQELRLQQAQTLLREGRLSIAAVGRTVGWGNAYYFSRVFRAHHGTSPHRWRQAQCSDHPIPC